MLVYDSRLLKVTRLNEIVSPVYGADDVNHEEMPTGYIYCDLATYQQVVTLNVRFEGDVNALTSLLLATVNHKEAIDYWASVVHNPFNMLAPYLGLITDKMELENDIEELAGLLHTIGKSIDFAQFVAIPMAARVNVLFGKSSFLMVKEEIRDYKRTLRSREREETADDVIWVSSEEISRVLSMAKEIIENMPGISLSTVNAPAAIESEDVGEDMIDEEDDWSDYVPPTPISMDWGTSDNNMVTKAIETVNKSAEAEDSEVSGAVDLMDKLMAGVTNSHNL
ncbi:TPA: hypothetical protein KOR75_001246 [Clostridioides difficile]|nr:hypothetical protein [Clostridioides difficile]